MRNHTWRSLIRLLGLALILVGSVRFGFHPQPGVAHEDHSGEAQTPASCSVLGWVPYWDQRRAAASLRKHVQTLDYVSFFWYYLDPEGEIREYEDAQVDPELITFARKNGVQVFALVANLPDDQREGDRDWDPDRVGAVIAEPEERAAHIEALVNLADELGVDGINIDYEALPRKYRSDFTAFIRGLARALHAEGKLLAVALHPKTSETNPAEDNGSHAQDWEALAKHADQLHLMTYGEHYSGTHPGPIASPDWVDSIVRYARDVREVPADRLFVGIPLYAEAWEPVGENRYRAARVDLTFADIQRVRKKHGGKLSTDAYDSPSFVFETRSGRERIVWFENRASVERKLAVAQNFGVCNFAFWRLGGEDPKVWKSVERAVRPEQ